MAERYWWQKNEEEDKQTQGNTQQGEATGFWWQRENIGTTIGNIAANRVNAWLKNHDNYVRSYQNRYAGRKFSYEDAYVSDSASWLDTVNKQVDDLEAERQAILAYMKQNRGYLNAEWMEKVRNSLAKGRDAQLQIRNSATQDNQWWNGFGSNQELVSKYGSAEGVYNYFQRADGYNKKYTGMTDDDIQKALGTLVDGEEKDWLDSWQWRRYFDESDFDKFSDAGAAIKNPTLKDAESGGRFLWWEWDGADIGNIVTYSRENADMLAMARADRVDTEGNHVYQYMKDDEVNLYNYLLAKYGKDKGDEFLSWIMDDLLAREGNTLANRLKAIDIPVVEEAAIGALGLAAGVDQWASGTRQFLTDEQQPTTSLQYANRDLMDSMSGLGKYAYQATNVIGNMLPSIALSKGLGALGAGVKAARLAGATTMSISAAGNAYSDGLEYGMEPWQARTYGTLVGAAEGALEYALGGIPAISKGDGFIDAKIKMIDNGLLRIGAKLGWDVIEEIREEELQNFLEPLFRSFFTGEYDAPTFEELLETAIVTAISTPVMGGGDTIVDDIRGGRKALEKYGNKTNELIKEGLESKVDSESFKLAQKYKAQTLAGKSMTGNQIRNLLEANQEQITPKDLKMIQKAAEKRLTDLGQTEDVSRLAELVTKYVTGQKMSKAEKYELASSDYGSRAAEEALPKNIKAGTHTSGWAENIGTRQVNVEAYNKTKIDQVRSIIEQLKSTEDTAQYKSLTERTGTEGRFGVSESGKATIRSTGEEIDINSLDVKTVGDGKITFEVGDREVSAGDIDFVDDNQSFLVSAVSNIENITAKDATVIIHELVDMDKPLGMQLNGIDEAFTYGFYDYSAEDLKAGLFAKNLSNEQLMSAYELGKAARKDIRDSKVDTFKRMRTAADAIAEKNAAEGKSTDAKNLTITYNLGGGKVISIDEAGITDDLQSGAVEVAKILHQLGLGTRVEFFSSYESDTLTVTDKETGETKKARVFKNDAGEEQIAYSGVYREADGTIRVDLNAYNGKKLALNALAHELTHFIQQWSETKYKVLVDFLMETYEKTGMTMHERVIRHQKFLEETRGKEVSYDEAYDEVVANAMMKMFDDGKLVERLTELKAKDKNLAQKLWEGFKKILAKFLGIYEKEGALFHDTADLMAMKEAFEQLQNMFAEALVEASENYQASLTPGVEGTTFNAKGEAVAHSTKDGTIQLSMHTYETEGKKALHDYLKKCVSSNKLTQAEMNKMIKGIEDIYQTCKEFKDKYAPFSTWSDAAVVRDTHGRPVFSVVTPNGDYKMNLDFSLVCKKRRTLDAVFNEMSKRGIIDDFELGQKSVVKINEIIRRYGFETACALCFVDAKRFRQASMADSFTRLYNELVESLVPEGKKSSISYFNFSGYETIKDVENGIDTWDNSKLDFSHINHVLKTYESGTVEYKTAKYIKSHAEGRKLLLRGDFMSSNGFDAVKTRNPDVLKLYNSKKGTGGPKAAFGDVQYMNEIIKKARWWTPAKAYSVGGVRVQSFSDYVPRMVFDYVQMIYDLAATKLPAHAYTKEALFVKQFGLTGIKINMSLIPAIAKNGIAPGLDANGNYVWAGESFDYNTAKNIQNAEGYTENCGTICVGVSYDHIVKLLRDPNIRMVIPYHKSGLNPIVAHMNQIAEFHDYTNDQRTKGKDGKAVETDFDFSNALHDMGENANPKAVADQYLKWCATKGYTPRFAEFAMEDNYYKLLEDFTLYDKDGNYVPQREVRAVFPTEDSAFGSMKSLIKEGLQEDAVIEGKRDKMLPEIVDEIQKSLPKTEAEIDETQQVEQADRDLETVEMQSSQETDVDTNADTDYDNIGLNDIKDVVKKGVGIKWNNGNVLKLGREEYAAVVSRISTEYKRRENHGGVQYIERSTDGKDAKFFLYLFVDHGFDNYEIIARLDYAKQDALIDELRRMIQNGRETERVSTGSSGLRTFYGNTDRSGNSSPNGGIKNAHDKKNSGGRGQRSQDNGRSGSADSDRSHERDNSTRGVKEQYSSQETDADNAPTFYSQMGKVVDGMKQEKFGASSVISMLRGRGVKAEEIRWSGIQAFLDGKKSVTKQELLDFIKGSMLHIEEEHRTANEPRDEFVREWQRLVEYLDADEILDGLNYIDTSLPAHLEDLVENEDLNQSEADHLLELAHRAVDSKDLPSKWHDYKLRGGENYRELVFKMPSSTYSNKAMQAHWGDDAQGVLAHARIQDFDTDNGKMLFIEEIQSDWHNEGHRTGYQGVPDAPFKGNYHEYVMKRLLRMAAEEGYDSIGWTTADIQSRRWSDDFAEGYRIEYDQDIPKFLKKYGKQWGAEVSRTTIDVGLSDLDSERVARHKRNIEYWQSCLPIAESDSEREFLQSQIDKEKAELDSIIGHGINDVWSMDITDAMKKSVLTEGQAMYSGHETDYSNRSLLANAFEGLSQNSDEYKMIQEYKGRIKLLNEQEEKLAKLNAEIREIRFTEGKYDAKKLKELEAQAKNIAEDINRQDRKLLDMEVSEPFRKVIEQERKKEALKTKAHVKEIQQNKKLRAEQTELRHKIRKAVRDLDKLLNRGNKKTNVKEDMKDFVSKALEIADYLFTDHISNDELIRRGITVRMNPREAALVKETEEIIAKLDAATDINQQGSKLTDEEFTRLDEKRKRNLEKLKDLLTSQRNERLNTPVAKLFDDLVKAYASLKNSSQDAVKAAYNEELEKSLRAFMSDAKVKILENMRVADMTTEELNWLYRAYTMVLTNVRKANEFHVKGMTETIDQKVGRIVSDFSGRKIPDKKLAIIARNLANKIGWDYEKLYYALDRIGSEAFTELIMNLANSENIVMADVIEAALFRDKMVEKYGFNDWEINKKIDKEFLDNTGKKFKLTLGELMSLYAYSRREGAWDHIEYGGFVFGKNDVTNPKPADTYKLSKEQCEAITNTLTEKQKGYVEEMQKFLSETMGAKGNEVSMMLYGIKMFGEKNYFPIHIAGQFKAQAQESQAKAAAGFGTMSNAGFTHAQNPNAKAPFVLEGFNDVWVDHVNEMSRYHGTVPALEDIRRVMNRSSYSDAYNESMSVKAVMENAFGKDAVDYFDNLYREANSGAITDKLQKNSKWLLSLFRKNSVAYSLSVLIQQPTSIIRAYAMIPKKYFGFKGFGTITSGVIKAVSDKWTNAHTNAYNEMLKYAPGVTMAKEIGGFDTHTGGSIRSYLLDTNKSFKQKWKTGTALEKGKAALDMVDNNAIANLPNLADKIAWIEIWNACKRETVATHKDLVPNSEEFMQAVGERFTEVIRATQVYDSIFAKSPLLKSKNLAVQYLTSFMNEPNTVANMAESAVRDAVRGDWKGGVKKAIVLAYGTIAVELVKSLVYALNDDDEDETYAEKYIEALVGSLVSDFNPLSYIPVVRDVSSLLQGYDIERPDMAIIADINEAWQAAYNYANKDTEDMTEAQIAKLEEKKDEATMKIVESVAAFFGIPVKNIRKDVMGIFNTVFNKTEMDTTKLSLKHAYEKALNDSKYFFLRDESKSKQDKLYEALVAGDTAYVNRLKAGYKDENAYNSAVRKLLRENDPRIHEAALAYYNGNLAEYKRIFKQIRNDDKQNIIGFDNTMEAVMSEVSAIKGELEGKTENSAYNATDFVNAILVGDTTLAQTMKEDIISYKVAHGSTQKEAEESFADSVTTSTRNAFDSGLLDEAGTEKMLQEYTGMDEEEAVSKVSYWSFIKAHPQYRGELSQSNVEKYHKFAEPAEIPLDIFVQYLDGTSGLADIKDKWGDVVKSKQDQVIEVIDSLPLTWQQKDALYLAYGYKESTLWKVNWS